MKKKNNKNTIAFLSEVAGKSKIFIMVLLVIQVILGISSVFYAMLLRKIVDEAVAKNRHEFFMGIVFFVLLVVFQIALRAVYRHFEELTRAKMENRFKKRLFSSLLKSDYSCVTAVHSGEWMNRLTSDTVVVSDGMTQILPGISGMTVKIIGALIAIFIMEPRFLYILIPGGIVLGFFTYAFRKVLKRLHKNIQETDGRLRVFFQERFGSLMVVRAFSREDQSIKKAAELMSDHKAARMKRNHFSNFCNIGFACAMNGVYVIGAAFCGYGILTGTMSYGNFMAVLQLISQIQNPFANITGFLPKYYAMLASAERIMEAESFPKDIYDSVAEEKRNEFYSNEFKGIELKNAAFTYKPISEDEREKMPVVLENLNVEIKKGEYVAFTGPSGCGKSTVLKLLMCLYPLDSGEKNLIVNDGKEELTSKWRSLFSYVPQNNQLLYGSIREIITFSDDKKMQDEEKIQTALRIACADEFVSKLENGIDTHLGERGTGLSEGQMQRIAIARAVFSDQPILLLDEATSALDETTESELLGNLRNMTDKTVIIVTHRPAALTICDKQIDFGRYEE